MEATIIQEELRRANIRIAVLEDSNDECRDLNDKIFALIENDITTEESGMPENTATEIPTDTAAETSVGDANAASNRQTSCE